VTRARELIPAEGSHRIAGASAGALQLEARLSEPTEADANLSHQVGSLSGQIDALVSLMNVDADRDAPSVAPLRLALAGVLGVDSWAEDAAIVRRVRDLAYGGALVASGRDMLDEFATLQGAVAEARAGDDPGTPGHRAPLCRALGVDGGEPWPRIEGHVRHLREAAASRRTEAGEVLRALSVRSAADAVERVREMRALEESACGLLGCARDQITDKIVCLVHALADSSEVCADRLVGAVGAERHLRRVFDAVSTIFGWRIRGLCGLCGACREAAACQTELAPPRR